MANIFPVGLSLAVALGGTLVGGGLSFDKTISLSDLIVLAGLLYALVKMNLTVDRHAEAIGKVGPPPTGILGELKRIDSEHAKHREALLRAGIDLD